MARKIMELRLVVILMKIRRILIFYLTAQCMPQKLDYGK